jgi:hypothetical protein
MTKPYKLSLHENTLPQLLSKGLPSSVVAVRNLEFRPTTFTSAIEGLKPRTFTLAKQLKMFDDFMDNPMLPKTYCIVSAPNDSQAKWLAAFMMQTALAAKGKHDPMPIWHNLLAGFANSLVDDKAKTSFLILNNVGTTSTAPKLEKLRDCLETFDNIPKVVIATGCDPFEFFTKYMYLPVNSVFYMTKEIVKRTIIS